MTGFGFGFLAREQEQEQLLQVLADASSPLTVVTVLGMGGVGKSQLLREVYAKARCSGWSAQWLDYTYETAPWAVLDRYFHARTASCDPTVLFIDHADQRPELEAWLANKMGECDLDGTRFRPLALDTESFTHSSYVVMIARRTPFTALRQRSFSRARLHECVLSPFTWHELSAKMSVSSADDTAVWQLFRLTGGHPSAIAYALKEGFTAECTPRPGLERRFIFNVTRLFTEELRHIHPPAVQALFGLALLCEATQDELAAVLGAGVDWQVYDALVQLSMTNIGSFGVRIHDTAARLLRLDMRWRAPQQTNVLLTRALVCRARRIVTLTRARPAGQGRELDCSFGRGVEPYHRQERAAHELSGAMTLLVEFGRLCDPDVGYAFTAMEMEMETVASLRFASVLVSALADESSVWCAEHVVPVWARPFLSKGTPPEGTSVVRDFSVGMAEHDDSDTQLALCEAAATSSPSALFYQFDGRADLSSWLLQVAGLSPVGHSTRYLQGKRKIRVTSSASTEPPATSSVAVWAPCTESDVRDLLKHLNHQIYLQEFVKERRWPITAKELRDQLVGMLITGQPQLPLTTEQQRVLRVSYLERPGTVIAVSDRLAMSRSTYYRILAEAQRNLTEVIALKRSWNE